MSQFLTTEMRAAFLAIADRLIPAAEGMPAASEAGIGELLDRVLSLRPDLGEACFRGMAATRGRASADAVESLNRDDPEALSTIGLVAAAAYFMTPRVRTLIGYPGQEKRTFDPHATPEYVANGMLQRVVDRGPIYRPTPV
jgi:hypothetical protein